MFLGDAHLGEDAGGGDCAGGAGRAVADGNAGKVEGDEEILSKGIAQRDVEDVADPVRATVDLGVGEEEEELFLEVIAEVTHVVLSFGKEGGEERDGCSQGGNAGEVFGSGSKSCLFEGARKGGREF